MLLNYSNVVFWQKIPTVWLYKKINIITTSKISLNHMTNVTLRPSKKCLPDHLPGNNLGSSDQQLPRTYFLILASAGLISIIF